MKDDELSIYPVSLQCEPLGSTAGLKPLRTSTPPLLPHDCKSLPNKGSWVQVKRASVVDSSDAESIEVVSLFSADSDYPKLSEQDRNLLNISKTKSETMHRNFAGLGFSPNSGAMLFPSKVPLLSKSVHGESITDKFRFNSAAEEISGFIFHERPSSRTSLCTVDFDLLDFAKAASENAAKTASIISSLEDSRMESFSLLDPLNIGGESNYEDTPMPGSFVMDGTNDTQNTTGFDRNIIKVDPVIKEGQGQKIPIDEAISKLLESYEFCLDDIFGRNSESCPDSSPDM
jgi:hypothetical protein